MLIFEQQEAFDSPNWIYELKMDGFRCLSYIDKNLVDLRNKRNLRMLSKFPELQKIYHNVQQKCILDGEIVVLRDGVPDFYLLQKRTLLTDRFKIELEAARHPASYVVFDCLYRANQDLIWEPLMQRKNELSQLITESPRIALSRYVEGTGIALYHAAESRKLEGVVAKQKESIYYMGKRSKEWIKFKRMTDEDFVVAGYIQKSLHTYSIVLGKYRRSTLIYKGQVTAGVTKEVIAHLNPIKENPFCILPTGNEVTIWVKPNHVCIVQYMPNTKNSLRQPVFKGFRNDVLAMEVQS
ncbi:MAG: DNA ligase [Hespellia sp.]|nr:DNA ligase [Hespellia sp.]